MNARMILVVEASVSAGINMWGALRKGYWPWPATFIRTGIAFALLLVLSLASEEMAALLGGAFLLAQILKTPTNSQGEFLFTGALPQEGTKNFPYQLLKFGSADTSGGNQYSGGLLGGLFNSANGAVNQATGQPGASVGGAVTPPASSSVGGSVG